MRINKPLNFVIPLYDGDQPYCWVHSTPIRQETFERWHLLIAKTFASIYGEGLDYRVGPRVASLRLRGIAEAMGQWEGPQGAQAGLVAEIRRLTNVVDPSRPDVVPWQVAVDQKMIDPSDVSEVENAVTFFTVASHMHRRHELKTVLEGAAGIWSAQVTSSNCTEFSASLRTSTAVESTGEMVLPFPPVARSSIPS
jgi:hypothetical protein